MLRQDAVASSFSRLLTILLFSHYKMNHQCQFLSLSKWNRKVIFIMSATSFAVGSGNSVLFWTHWRKSNLYISYGFVYTAEFWVNVPVCEDAHAVSPCASKCWMLNQTETSFFFWASPLPTDPLMEQEEKTCSNLCQEA